MSEFNSKKEAQKPNIDQFLVDFDNVFLEPFKQRKETAAVKKDAPFQ